MTADILALLSPQTPDTWPQGILAAADLREWRCDSVTRGDWYADGQAVRVQVLGLDETPAVAVPPARTQLTLKACEINAEHIAAEANPAHALAAVRHWRGVVERHCLVDNGPKQHECCRCVGSWAYEEGLPWPCDDIRETADEARDYVSGGPE